MNPKITLVVACDKNFAIGKDDTLPWKMPSDLKHFKKYTEGKIVVTGMNTFNSLPHLLENRLMFVMSRNVDAIQVLQAKADKYRQAKNTDSVPFCAHTTSLENFIELIIEYFPYHEEICIIGGRQIYDLFLPFADKIVMTMIEAEIDGADTHFTVPDSKLWKITSIPVRNNKTDVDEYAYSIHIFEKVPSARIISISTKQPLSKLEVIKLRIDSK